MTVRMVLLTSDPALHARVKAIAGQCGCSLVEAGDPRVGVQHSWTPIEADVVVLDARLGEAAPTAPHPLGGRWAVPTLALVEHGHAGLLSSFLRQSPAHEMALLSAGEAVIDAAVRDFLARHAQLEQPALMCWGMYVFDVAHGRVSVGPAPPMTLSRHKLRFALSLFMHQDILMSWAQLHRLAWGDALPPRQSMVAAHAAWAREVLSLDGSWGVELEADALHCYCLRSIADAQPALPLRAEAAPPPPAVQPVSTSSAPPPHRAAARPSAWRTTVQAGARRLPVL